MSGPAAPAAPARELVAAGRPRAMGPLLRLTSRALLGRRRSLGVVLLAAAPVLVAAILAVGGGLGEPGTLAFEVFSTVILALVVPLAALILGTAALGTGIDDGTIVYLLVKPVPRSTPVLAAMVVAAGATAILTGLATLVVGLLLLGARDPGLLVGMVLGDLLASILYAAAFVTLSVYTGRALIVGLAYVLVWEGLVTPLLTGTRILSIREYALSVVTTLGGSAAGNGGQAGVELPVAIILSVAVLVLAFVLGSRRLGRFEVTDGG